MDPSELRMNLASLQRLDPFIAGILMSSPQVALYKFGDSEWEKTNIEGTLFVYERTCEPAFGFLILNRLSSTNLIQPITKDIELQDKTPFLLYKNQDIHGIWFYEEGNCKKLFQIIDQVIEKLKTGGSGAPKPLMSNQHFAKGHPGNVNGNKVAKSNGEISLADLLNNAGNKEKGHQHPPIPAPSMVKAGTQNSPSGGEKLLRLLSISEQSKDDIKPPQVNNGDSVAAFFAQVSQASTHPNAGPPPGIQMHPGLQMTSPQKNPLQSLLSDPAVMSVEAGNGGPMPPLPVMAKSASDLESDLKPKPGSAKKSAKKTTNAKKTVTRQEASNGGNGISYASVAAPSAAEAPQLLSPMVFSGQSNTSGSPQVSKQTTPLAAPPSNGPQHQVQVMPTLNGIPAQMPMVPQITPLTQAQLLQAFQHLLRTDRGFVTKLHQAYVESLNTQLN